MIFPLLCCFPTLTSKRPKGRFVALRFIYLKVFTIYGHGGHLGHVTWTNYTNFCSPFPRRLHKNLALNGQAVSEEMFEIVDDHDDNDDHNGYTFSSPGEPDGSVELIEDNAIIFHHRTKMAHKQYKSNENISV